ncbi:hypothetical protein BDP55DRAFT_669261 [Colletotrichum godetiae]|uniref:Secreted protein n=1 Tax=Colletotrichum godetiae TaxID=1209918 RepID=A0AAJ0AH53_9PEZI|nr:uncharacterized protein BDP55DRAFT_669261 [Colletotrichum godetiae]KAK1673796.1 hypothetical protein BDP55DRAFT_669261 [Colletotrichum godetiae]
MLLGVSMGHFALSAGLAEAQIPKGKGRMCSTSHAGRERSTFSLRTGRSEVFLTSSILMNAVDRVGSELVCTGSSSTLDSNPYEVGPGTVKDHSL